MESCTRFLTPLVMLSMAYQYRVIRVLNHVKRSRRPGLRPSLSSVVGSFDGPVFTVGKSRKDGLYLRHSLLGDPSYVAMLTLAQLRCTQVRQIGLNGRRWMSVRPEERAPESEFLRFTMHSSYN